MGNCCASRKREEAPCQSDNEDNSNIISINDIETYKEKIQLLIRVIKKDLGKCEDMKIKQVEICIEEGEKLLFDIEKNLNNFEQAQMTIDIGKLFEKCKSFVDKSSEIKNLTQKSGRLQYNRNEMWMPPLNQRAIESFKSKISNIQTSDKYVMKKEELIVVFV